MRIERLRAMLFAKRHGYFWLPCPLCGEHFGGHEWTTHSDKPSSIPVPGQPGLGQGICPECTERGLGKWTYEVVD